MSQPLLPEPLRSLLAWFAPLFTAPSFAYFQQWIVAMMLCEGRKCATTVFAHGPRERHFTNYSRFLSRYRWCWEQVAQALVGLLGATLPFGQGSRGKRRVYLALDDTLVAKSGRRQPGIGYHFEPNSNHGGRFVRGHCWVVLGALLWLGRRALCFPVHAALYVRAADCPRPGDFQDKIELALGLLQNLHWPVPAALTVIADGAYAVRRFLSGAHERGYQIITRLKSNAKVHLPLAPPARRGRGRPRKYGLRVDLRAWAQDPCHLRQVTLPLYGQPVRLEVGALEAVPAVLGQLARVVVVHFPNHPLVVLMSSDRSLSAEQIVQRYAARFSIEIVFRELKQRFGVGDYQVRSREAILRHVQLSLVACSLLQALLVAVTLRQAKALLALLAQPWRDPRRPLTLGQTRLLLQQLLVLEGIFSPSAPQRFSRKSQLDRLRAAFAGAKCAKP
jgi:hypothetical protein